MAKRKPHPKKQKRRDAEASSCARKRHSKQQGDEGAPITITTRSWGRDEAAGDEAAPTDEIAGQVAEQDVVLDLRVLPLGLQRLVIDYRNCSSVIWPGISQRSFNTLAKAKVTAAEGACVRASRTFYVFALNG